MFSWKRSSTMAYFGKPTYIPMEVEHKKGEECFQEKQTNKQNTTTLNQQKASSSSSWIKKAISRL